MILTILGGVGVVVALFVALCYPWLHSEWSDKW